MGFIMLWKLKNNLLPRCQASGKLRRVVSLKLTNVSEVLTASIVTALTTLMMEMVVTSETSVSFSKTTRRSIPEGCHIHTRGRKDLTSHTVTCNFQCISFVLMLVFYILFVGYRELHNEKRHYSTVPK
jgi:hypothetical protein